MVLPKLTLYARQDSVMIPLGKCRKQKNVEIVEVWFLVSPLENIVNSKWSITLTVMPFGSQTWQSNFPHESRWWCSSWPCLTTIRQVWDWPQNCCITSGLSPNPHCQWPPESINRLTEDNVCRKPGNHCLTRYMFCCFPAKSSLQPMLWNKNHSCYWPPMIAFAFCTTPRTSCSFSLFLRGLHSHQIIQNPNGHGPCI